MSGQPETIVSPRPEICSTITLYKYISKRGLEGLIENGSLKVTYRSDCNDPQEMTPYGEHPDKYNTYPENGFISFSKEGNNAPMWGNYAENYKGACLVFEFPYFDEQKRCNANPEEKHILEYTNYLKELGFKVKYFNAFYDKGIYKPSICSRVLIDCKYTSTHYRIPYPDGSENWEEAEEKAQNHRWALMCTKDAGWSYEQEVRMLLVGSRDIENSNEKLDGNHVHLTKIPIRYIKQIILGPKCSLSKESVEKDMEANRAKHEKPDLYLPMEVKVINARFSKYSFPLIYTEQEEEEPWYN